MPDPKEITKEKDSFDEAIDNINKSLNEQFAKQNEKFDDIDKKIDDIKPEKEPKWFKEDETEEENSYITKKDLKSFAKLLSEKVLEKSKETSKETLNEVMTQNMNKNKRDVEALQEYPMLAKGNPSFDAAFHKEVGDEMNNRIKRGITPDNEDLLYDSASSVLAKWAKQGKYVAKKMVDDETRRLNNADDNFSFSGSIKPNLFKPTQRQFELAAKVGLSKEALLQHFEKIKKNH